MSARINEGITSSFPVHKIKPKGLSDKDALSVLAGRERNVRTFSRTEASHWLPRSTAVGITTLALCGIGVLGIRNQEQQPPPMVKGFNQFQFTLQATVTEMIADGRNEITFQIMNKKDEESHKTLIKEMTQNINADRAKRNLPPIQFIIGPVDDAIFHPQRNRMFEMQNLRVRILDGMIVQGNKVK